MGYDPATGDRVRRFGSIAEALAGRAGVTIGSRRRGFGSSALQVSGRIFAMLRNDRLVLRLPPARVAELLAAGEGVAFDAGKGRPLKEWVAVGEDSEAQWLSLAEEALTFVAGLGRGMG